MRPKVFSDCALLRIWLKFKVALTLLTWWEKLRKFPDFHYHFSFLVFLKVLYVVASLSVVQISKKNMHEINLKKKFFFQNWVVLWKRCWNLCQLKPHQFIKTNLKSDSKLVFRESRQLFLFFNDIFSSPSFWKLKVGVCIK